MKKKEKLKETISLNNIFGKHSPGLSPFNILPENGKTITSTSGTHKGQEDTPTQGGTDRSGHYTSDIAWEDGTVTKYGWWYD